MDKCDNCGLESDDLHEVNMTTDNETEWYCTNCFDEWCGKKPKGVWSVS